MARETVTSGDSQCELLVMSDTEDYPGPTKDHPEKQGQDPRGRTSEKMVKPPAKPRGKPKKKN
jgi:hypothetical protein